MRCAFALALACGRQLATRAAACECKCECRIKQAPYRNATYHLIFTTDQRGKRVIGGVSSCKCSLFIVAEKKSSGVGLVEIGFVRSVPRPSNRHRVSVEAITNVSIQNK